MFTSSFLPVMHIDLNADLGEGAANDPMMIPLVSSANISCGAHAGNEKTIRTALALCAEAGVEVGAHPGYADPETFGRRALSLTQAELRSQLLMQLEWFATLAASEGMSIAHVKPHGALYLQSDRSPELAGCLAAAVAEIFPRVAWFCPWGGCQQLAAGAAGFIPVFEGFADRRYLADGSLAPRHLDGAVIDAPEDCARQAKSIVVQRNATTVEGGRVALQAETLCVHGDGDGAVQRLLAVRLALLDAGWQIRPPRNCTGSPDSSNPVGTAAGRQSK